MATSPIISFSQPPPVINRGSVVALPGQSIYDVCLMTYGTIDLIYKLIQDNNIGVLNYSQIVGHTFIFDTTKIKDAAVYLRNQIDNIIYATLHSPSQGIIDSNIELREDVSVELREDGGIEIRE